MPHDSIWTFFINNLTNSDVHAKKILEIGSYHKYGGIRKLIETYFEPKEYIGADIRPGPGVDVVIPSEDLLTSYGKNSFDLIIATEVIEHIRDYRNFIYTIESLLNTYGLIMLTTRSFGFGYHLAPFDFWRFSESKINQIFENMRIDVLEKDSEYPGIFVKAHKPASFLHLDINEIAVYSIVYGKYIRFIPSYEEGRILCKLSRSLTRTRNPLLSGVAGILNHFIM